MNLKKIVVPALAAVIFCCGGARAASLRVSRVPAANLHLSLNALPNVHGPALQGGFGLSRLPESALLPNGLRSVVGGPAVTPTLGAAVSLSAGRTVGAFASVNGLSRRLSDDGVDKSNISNNTFDGSNNGSNSGGGIVSADGSPLHKLFPKVVFLQDVFSGPASEPVVAYVEKLLAAGVHVVFMTSRPLKGPGSAEEVLMSRIKTHRDNPVIVVSYNGGKISIHGRAANPKSLIEDVGAFPVADLETLKVIDAKVAKALGVEVKVEGQPKGEAPFSYTAELPASVSDADAPKARAKMLARYNALLEAAKMPYRMEAHPENARAVVTYSMPMRFSLPRVLAALDEVFHGEKLGETPGKFLILADSRRSPKFSSAFPKEAEVQVVGAGAAVEDVLGAVLGDRKLAPVSINLSKLRQFVEYWEPTRRFREGGERSSQGGVSRPKADRETDTRFAGFVTNVINKVMSEFYDNVFRGQDKGQAGTLSVLQAKLRAAWFNPFNNGVWVPKGLAKIMGTAVWKAMSKGYFEYANAYLVNFYLREFGDYSAAASDVRMNLVGLNGDANSLATLELMSAATGKMYKIHTRIPRVMKRETADGLVLTAYAYRPNKEKSREVDAFFARILALSLLKAHGKLGADGKWHFRSPEGPLLGKLNVQLEYRAGQQPWSFEPEEFYTAEKTADGWAVRQGPIAAEITSAIEREEADLEYQAHSAEEDATASKADAKKPSKKSSKKSGRR